MKRILGTPPLVPTDIARDMLIKLVMWRLVTSRQIMPALVPSKPGPRKPSAIFPLPMSRATAH
jgi:hypothetical protein